MNNEEFAKEAWTPKCSNSRKPLKPGPWGLFETIEGFLEFTNILRMMCINIPRGLYHVCLPLSTPWRKEFWTSSYLRGQLNWTTRENDSHCRWFDHRDKSLIKGHPILLVKRFSHQPSLIFTNIPITVMFQLEDPLAANYILRWGRRN